MDVGAMAKGVEADFPMMPRGRAVVNLRPGNAFLGHEVLAKPGRLGRRRSFGAPPHVCVS